MVIVTTKIYMFKHMCMNICYIKFLKRNYVPNIAQQNFKSETHSDKQIHPYKQIHPWKSLHEFSQDLLDNIIYNKDGLVVLNKPYGIRRSNEHKNLQNRVSRGVNYTLTDALPHIRSQLKYPDLSILRSPEMYMSGITLLVADSKVERAVQVAFARSHFFSNTYWMITVGVPKQLKNQHRLGIKLISNPAFNHKKAVITTSWSRNDEKKQRIKLLKIDYEVLSNSTHNLCSLIQIKASTENRHAIRLFASTFLYCPILGDNICASQIQKVGGVYVKVNPFLVCTGTPKLDSVLLKLLHVSQRQQSIIPAHVHLKSVFLPSIFGEDLTVEAPLMPSFYWTCKQLEFKYLMQNNCT